MKYRILTTVLAAALITGCSETQTAPTELFTPEFNAAPSCFTPQFKVEGAWKGIPYTYNDLDVTGDLEGLVTLVFDPGSVQFAGVTHSISGTAYWSITGGIIPGLGTFETKFDNLNHWTDRPGSPANIAETQGTHRAFSDVEKANLTYKGTAYFPAGVGILDLDFQGVICP